MLMQFDDDNKQPRKRKGKGSKYGKKRADAAARSRAASKAGRDIGELPAAADSNRRVEALADLLVFCRTYFPHRFPLPFSPDHLKVVRKLQEAILTGGLFSIAMPRGSGKTTITEVACIFGMFSGQHDFVVLIGADKEAAGDMLDSIKGELEGNDLLAADFPEVCLPIRQLEGIALRCKGQTYRGKRTHIEWSASRVTLPTIEGSAMSGATVRCAGITGRIRGLKHTKPDGSNARPTLVVADDPQTDEAAGSATMTAKLLRTMNGAVLGLAGPGRKMSGVMPCTVIRHGDMADTLLDRKQSPEWHGERCQMLYALPENMELWESYNEIRVAELQAGRGLAAATAFYRKNIKAMDKGAIVGWPERFNGDEISGLQHAMNKRFVDLWSFEAEFQNNPPAENELSDEDICTADQIAQKVNGYAQRIVPGDATKLVAFVDVQKRCFYWLVLAVTDDFTGWVVDYGAFPDQGVRHFAYAGGVNRTIADLAKRLGHTGAGLEGRLTVGLRELIEKTLAPREYIRDTGGVMRIDLIGIDMGWQADVVRSYIRSSAVGAMLWPVKGVGVKAGDCPLSDWRVKRGAKKGVEWIVFPPPKGQAVRHVMADANYWKTFTHARLSMAPGDKGGHTLYKASATHHRLLADHLTAEKPEKTTGRGRDVIEWKLPPAKPDNHLFDCLAGANVIASLAGARLAHETRPPTAPRRRRRVEF